MFGENSVKKEEMRKPPVFPSIIMQQHGRLYRLAERKRGKSPADDCVRVVGSLSLSVLEISLPLSAVDVITDRVQACQTIRTSATVQASLSSPPRRLGGTVEPDFEQAVLQTRRKSKASASAMFMPNYRQMRGKGETEVDFPTYRFYKRKTPQLSQNLVIRKRFSSITLSVVISLYRDGEKRCSAAAVSATAADRSALHPAATAAAARQFFSGPAVAPNSTAATY